MEREQGGRLFICATAARFWEYYTHLHPGQRHHYEIIRQGMPCHLYFGERAQCMQCGCCVCSTGADKDVSV